MPSIQINDFFIKRKQKKIELVARPGCPPLPGKCWWMLVMVTRQTRAKRETAGTLFLDAIGRWWLLEAAAAVAAVNVVF